VTTARPGVPNNFIPAPQRASGGLLALGIISIIYSAVFRLCCGLFSFIGLMAMSLVASEAMQSLMDMPQMEGMGDYDTIMSGPMQIYSFMQAFMILGLGLGMLVGGIGLIRRMQWGRTLSLGIAAGEIAWAIVDLGINTLFIFPMMSQSMPDEFAQGPAVIGNVIGAIFFTFFKLAYPVALLVCLNLRSIKAQFGIFDGPPPLDSFPGSSQ
jgi:hypothetical protein